VSEPTITYRPYDPPLDLGHRNPYPTEPAGFIPSQHHFLFGVYLAKWANGPTIALPEVDYVNDPWDLDDPEERQHVVDRAVALKEEMERREHDTG
jgi:hypothetical protein